MKVCHCHERLSEQSHYLCFVARLDSRQKKGLKVLKEASAQAVTILRGNVASKARAAQALVEAVRMDPDATTKQVLRTLADETERIRLDSER